MSLLIAVPYFLSLLFINMSKDAHLSYEMTPLDVVAVSACVVRPWICGHT